MSEETLKLIEIELNSISPDEYQDSPDDVEPRDTVLGLMSDYEKKVYTLRNKYADSAKEAYIRIELSRNKQESIPYRREFYYSKHTSDILSSLLWVTLNEHFNAWDAPVIAVRSNHTVVSTKPDIKDFFDTLRGDI